MSFFFFFQAEDGIRDFCLSRGLGDVYKRQFILLYNAIFLRWKKSCIVLFLPVLLFLILTIYSGNRSPFIHYIVFIIVVMAILYGMKNNWTKRPNRKILIAGISGIAIFFLIFSLMGFFMNRVDSLEDSMQNIAGYTGGAIPALDRFLTSFTYDIGQMGKETMQVSFPICPIS